MNEVNLNYAATSNKKPPSVISAMTDYLCANNFKSPGRGGGADSIELEARMVLGRLFGVRKIENIVFTSGATAALNMILHGALSRGDHVISTALEHNAVARPLEILKKQGIIDVTYLPCENGMVLDPDTIKSNLLPNTKLMVMTHASNVSGAILDYESCAKIAKEHGLIFVMDAAQTAGLIDIDFDNSNIDALAFTGHKTLMGPSGIGGFILKPHMAAALTPIVSGGTGSLSHLLEHPEFMPDKFQPGTPNVLGIIGLSAAASYVLETGVKNIFEHELKLTNIFMEGIRHDDVMIYGPCNRVPIVSFNISGVDNSVLEERLSREFGIVTRSGLHCSPLAHKSIGTYPEGAIRASFGYFNTEDEVEYAIQAVNKIISSKA